MNDTPRMDLALRKAQEDCTESYLLTEGLKLERELNAANAIIRQQQLLDEENLRLQERINQRDEWNKRLDELIDRQTEKIILLSEIRQEAGLQDANLRKKLSEANDRIKRLEEAGDALCENSNPSRWDSPADAARKLMEQSNWRKAKEAKP